MGRKSEDDKDVRSDDGNGDDGGSFNIKAALRTGAAAKLGKGNITEDSSPETSGTRPRDVVPYQDDDAASEGGQSAMSAQSASGGAEYKRGKRFRKLVKLMDSGQAQQVQQRFRTHALATMGLLAIVHTVCFILTIMSINSKRDSMLQLGRAGQSQRYMYQVLTDVRSLDVIVKNKTQPNLYAPADAAFFVDRISTGADEIQVRLKEVLDAYHTPSSSVKELFFYSTRKVWDGNDPVDGSDIWINVTIWDFGTRFDAAAKDVAQHFFTWQQNNVSVADTRPGQFLIKSGPDLWRASRKILDALLFIAVDNARWVETLQVVFLVVEGAVITSIAACYLAHLLRALAAQRYKLYSTFLVIPVGLTRVLASQNTTLLVDDDEDSDDEEDDRETTADNEEAGNNTLALKPKRRAVLSVMPNGVAEDDAEECEPLQQRRRSDGSAGRSTGADTLIKSSSRRHLASKLTTQPSMSASQQGLRATGCFGRLRWWLRHPFGRRSRGVAPLPQSMVDSSGISFTAGAKRKLKYDSHETAMVLLPFVLWSALVIVIYVLAVEKIMGIVEVVAVHSVSNFISARAYRSVFYSQELAVAEDSAQLATRRTTLIGALKVVKDAWYTLQLGENAYRAAGPSTERFPLVTDGLAYASPELADIFYSAGKCHRVQEPLACPGPDYRFYQIIHAGLDSIMQQFMMKMGAMATDTSMAPAGLADENLDFIYNVGSKDLIDGTVQIQEAHYKTIIARFDGILVLHVVLFILFWVIFAGFLILLLNPLLKRVTRERRRIAELISQLPLELDVEKLVARALGAVPNTGTGGTAGGQGAGGAGGVDPNADGGVANTDDSEGTQKWKAIIRSASTQFGQAKAQGVGAGSTKLTVSGSLR